MSLFHRCNECRTCPKCYKKNCTTNLEPYKLNSVVEGDWILRKCAWCNSVIEKYQTLSSLRDGVVLEKDKNKN